MDIPSPIYCSKDEIHYTVANAKFVDLSPYTDYVSLIENKARICYKSEGKSERGTLIKSLISKGHLTPLETVSVTAHIVTSRSVSHELVRHRLASFCQESQRFVKYNAVSIIVPVHLQDAAFGVCGDSKTVDEYQRFKETAEYCVWNYKMAIECGFSPEQAREHLHNAVATKLYMTANLREWRHIFKLRVAGTTGKPHPDMRYVMGKLLAQAKAYLPEVFGDISE